MPKPTIYEELYPGRFLKAALFKGTKPTMTIKDVDVEMLEDAENKPKAKAIITFVERPMQLVACKTNGICIKAMFGNQLKDWVGKRLTLFEGQWNGEPCIRVWGSPDIAADIKVSVELPRRKPIPMVMHAVKASKKDATETAPDPRIAAAWELLGWNTVEGQESRKGFSGTDAEYLIYLNGQIDEMNAA